MSILIVLQYCNWVLFRVRNSNVHCGRETTRERNVPRHLRATPRDRVGPFVVSRKWSLDRALDAKTSPSFRTDVVLYMPSEDSQSRVLRCFTVIHVFMTFNLFREETANFVS